jgi:hypothetical protein
MDQKWADQFKAWQDIAHITKNRRLVGNVHRDYVKWARHNILGPMSNEDFDTLLKANYEVQVSGYWPNLDWHVRLKK